ncbi:type I restriction enzyme HsdR N-terminal domain-containing protein [Myxococcota bacterium]|nr:type I restriction enzyme HsdR N-terminal domain-containing protein [Myxococcota bacterium]
MSFQDDVLRFSDQIKARIPHIKGEEATKHALVVPFLQVLGYDVFDPREVKPEYAADFAKKRSGQQEKIDYAIFLNDAPVMFIECKPVGADLSDHEGQLARYFNATPTVRVALITNGVQLRVFTDLQQPNVMDPNPWLDVDLLSPKAAEIEALKRFRKFDFSANDVVSLAEEMVYYNSMTSFFAAQLREPTEPFVRFVLGETLSVNRVTAKIIERLTPIMRKALQAAILEHMARSFDRGPSTPQPAAEPTKQAIDAQPPPVPAQPVAAQEPGASEGRAGVVTTAEELACWERVAGWVREVHPNGGLGYRDSKTYFTMHQGVLRKWFLRVNVAKEPWWISLRHVKPEECRLLAPGVEASDGGYLGDSKLALRSIEDLSKVRSAIIAAYDKEAARTGDDDGSTEDAANP